MSNIEKVVQAAIEEFGEDAYKRFTHKGMAFNDEPCRSNEFLLRMLSVNNVSIKPLPELFAHDVVVYGDNAYLMWLISERGIWCELQGGMLDTMNREPNRFKRRTSAALPFDLGRAMAGDVAEYFAEDLVSRNGHWIIAENNIAALLFKKDKNRDDLRMKYPKTCNHETV